MTKCPFCQGQATTPHSAQDCLAHVRVRLREMTERRDALQISLDNQRRTADKYRDKARALKAALDEERARRGDEQRADRATARRALQALRVIKRACEAALQC